MPTAAPTDHRKVEPEVRDSIGVATLMEGCKGWCVPLFCLVSLPVAMVAMHRSKWKSDSDRVITIVFIPLKDERAFKSGSAANNITIGPTCFPCVTPTSLLVAMTRSTSSTPTAHRKHMGNTALSLLSSCMIPFSGCDASTKVEI